MEASSSALVGPSHFSQPETYEGLSFRLSVRSLPKRPLRQADSVFTDARKLGNNQKLAEQSPRHSKNTLKTALITSHFGAKPVAAVGLGTTTPVWHAGGQEFESPWLHFPEAQACPGLFCAQHP